MLIVHGHLLGNDFVVFKPSFNFECSAVSEANIRSDVGIVKCWRVFDINQAVPGQMPCGSFFLYFT